MVHYIYYYIFVNVMLLCQTEARNHEEPVCSKYDFEEKVLERLVRLEHKLELHHSQLKAWEDKMEKQLSEIKDAEVDRTKTIATTQRAIQQELEGQQAKLGEVLTNFQEQVARMSNDLVEKEAHVNKTLQMFINQKETIVFFSVDSPTKSLANGVPLFSGINANVAGGYDMATGRFTCSIPGLYHFSVTFLTDYGSAGGVCVYIRHNSARIVSAYTTAIRDMHNSATTSTYLSLAMGDTVDLGSCRSWNLVNTGDHSMFTGALITPS